MCVSLMAQIYILSGMMQFSWTYDVISVMETSFCSTEIYLQASTPIDNVTTFCDAKLSDLAIRVVVHCCIKSNLKRIILFCVFFPDKNK